LLYFAIFCYRRSKGIVESIVGASITNISDILYFQKHQLSSGTRYANDKLVNKVGPLDPVGRSRLLRKELEIRGERRGDRFVEGERRLLGRTHDRRKDPVPGHRLLDHRLEDLRQAHGRGIREDTRGARGGSVSSSDNYAQRRARQVFDQYL
jgi:hypothetical protein